MIPAEPCIDANILVAFAAGELSAPEHARVERHVDACPSCAELLREALDGFELTGHSVGHSVAHSVGHSVGPAAEGTVAYMRPQAESGGLAALPRGSVIGRYIILTLIGEGGLGRVYAAYDPELDRQVALKLLRSAGGSADSEQRLIREAQAMAKLSDPHVVPVHDVGMSDRGPFIAMDLVDGGDFSQWLAARPRRWKETRKILVEAGKGLVAAHRAGLVHRDFKAGNVLLDRSGRVMVTDFGLARSVSVVGHEDSLARPHQGALGADLTQVGTVMGTPGYMAPESFTGAPWDARADQFSFCVTAYRALFGILPFPRQLTAFITSVRAGQIAQPGPTTVPTWLRRAIERGLSPSPDARHDTIDALLQEMSRDRRVRRRWWQGIATTVLAGSVAAGLTIALVEPEPTTAERDAVQGIVQQARNAASRSYYVYPSADDADSPTAFRSVLELEGMEGPAHDAAVRAAGDLRTEFAATLVRLGDAYWEKPGGIPFAAEYYAAALMFDPAEPRALERMLLTPAELAALRDRAAQGEFTSAELSAAELLAALAETDPEQRQARLEALQHSDRLPLVAQARLAEIVGPRSGPPRDGRRKPRPTSDDDGDDDALVIEDEETTGPAPAGDPPPPDQPARHIDRRAAAAAVTAGRRAIAANDMKAAERAFVRALQYDPHSAAAYAGLGEVYFESGRGAQAVSSARKAVRRAPRVARYRMLLGDAYLQVLDLHKAKTEYEKADELGHPAAKKRLETVDAKQR